MVPSTIHSFRFPPALSIFPKLVWVGPLFAPGLSARGLGFGIVDFRNSALKKCVGLTATWGVRICAGMGDKTSGLMSAAAACAAVDAWGDVERFGVHRIARALRVEVGRLLGRQEELLAANGCEVERRRAAERLAGEWAETNVVLRRRLFEVNALVRELRERLEESADPQPKAAR